VLMDNHYHLLLELAEANLSRAVQWLNVSYSVWFNRRHHRSGHLFQGRFKSVVVSPDEWALGLSRYIHLNPVRVGRLGLNKAQQQRIRVGAGGTPDGRLVRQRIDQLREHRWSSYRAYIGLAARPAWLQCDEVLASGGGKGSDRRRHYREYVESAVREGLEKSPWEELRDQVVLGGPEFVKKLRSRKAETPREDKLVQRLAGARPGFTSVVAAVERVKGERWVNFRERHGDTGRDLAIYLGRKHGGLRLVELAQATGLLSDASVAMCLRRYEARLQSDEAEQKRLQEATQLLIVRM